MSDIHADELIRVAGDDVASARVLLSTLPPMLSVAAYHAEQAAEKVVKAALVKLGLSYARTHNVNALVAALPVAHKYATHGALLAATSPWATEFRYTTSTPPSANEINQALDAALRLSALVSRDLASPKTSLTRGLAATTPESWLSDRIVCLWVGAEIVARAIASPQASDKPDVIALRAIAETSVHQPEHEIKDASLPLTGRTLYDWAGVYHIDELMRVRNQQGVVVRLCINALKLDETVRAHPELQPGFAALLAFNDKQPK